MGLNLVKKTYRLFRLVRSSLANVNDFIIHQRSSFARTKGMDLLVNFIQEYVQA